MSAELVGFPEENPTSDRFDADEGLTSRLSRAAEYFFDQPRLTLLSCRRIAALRPDCLAQAYVRPGLDGQRRGPAVAIVRSEVLPDPGARGPEHCRFLRSLERASLEAGGWVEAVGDRLVSSREFADIVGAVPTLRGRGLQDYGCLAIGIGSRVVAALGLFFPEGSSGLTARERERLLSLASDLAPVLRAASLISHEQAALRAADHLLAARGDCVFLVSRDGHIIGASATGHQLLDRHGSVRAVVADAARQHPGKRSSIAVPSLGLELHVTPCSPSGGAPISLVSVGPLEGEGRRRLSPRQGELLHWLAEGLSNKEIAARMGLAASTVKTMLEHLYRLAGVSGRVGLLRWSRTPAPSSEGPA